MPKFSASSANDLRTTAANVGRVARKAAFVVTCEADDGSWFELDANTMAHAKILADNQVDTMGCRGASCWRVNPNGVLEMRFFYNNWSGG